jgi:hypothetical protein
MILRRLPFVKPHYRGSVKENAMERYRPSSRKLESTTYRISVQGTLDEHLSAYYGGMKIEHRSDPKRHAMTILTGLLVDQCALMGVLNSLHDTDYPILLVERIEASSMRILPDPVRDDVAH